MEIGAYAQRGESGTADEFAGMARLAEQIGFTSLWMGDHVIIPKAYDNSRYPYAKGLGGAFNSTSDRPWLECITALGFLAGSVKKLKLGLATLVVPYRNPVLQAKMFSTVDVLSDGRLIVGVGTGWMKEEFEVLRTAPYEDRGSVTDEYIELFIELWTKENPNYQGQHYQVSGIGVYPKPVQKPHIPIWVGGHTGRAYRRLAKYGSGWQPHMLTPEDIKSQLPVLQRYLEEAGRSLDEIRISAGVGFRIDNETRAERRPFQGTPQQIIDDVRRYEEVGVHEMRLLTGYPDGLGGMTALDTWKRFGEEIMPRI